MTTKELIAFLLDCDMDKEVVVQKNEKNGNFTLHTMLIAPAGHIWHNGPIIYTMDEIPFRVQKTQGIK